MKSIIFSIIICNYNYAQFLNEAIESCLAQDYPSDLFEIIVVDDGSTDNSLEMLSGYKQNKNIQVISQSNNGQASAISAGLKKAKGQYICLLDSDDYFLPNKLSVIANHIKSYSSISDYFFLCHDLKMLNDQTKLFALASWYDFIHLDFKFVEPELWNVFGIEHSYPFAVPCGQIHSKKLLQNLFENMSVSDWRRGVDTAIAHGASMLTEGVHYSYEPLSVYRVHLSNNYIGIDSTNNTFIPKINCLDRVPKLVSFLTKLIYQQNFSESEQNDKLNKLEILEQTFIKQHSY